MLKEKRYEVTVSVNATVTIVVEAANEEEAKSVVEEMGYTEFENKEYEVHGICDIDASCDVKRFDVCAVCGNKLYIEDACYEDSISGGALCDGHAIYVEAQDVYVPDFDILIENAAEVYDESGDFWYGTTHYDVNIFEKDGELWSSVYRVKDEQTDAGNVVYPKKLIVKDSLCLSVTDEIVDTETTMTPISNEIAAAISFLQSAGYAVVTTALDHEAIGGFSASEVKSLARAFPDALTAGGSLYLALFNLGGSFENFDEEVKPIVKKILDSIPQKTGRPELVLI